MTTTNSNKLGYSFHAIPDALYLIDLKLKYKSPSSGKVVTNDLSRDEIAIYSKMQGRFEFFRSEGKEYYDSYADIGKMLRIPRATVTRIVPRLRKAGLLNYKTATREGESNVYTYFIRPMDLVQKYDGAVIDATGNKPVVTYRNGTDIAPTDIPQVLADDTVWRKAHPTQPAPKLSSVPSTLVDEPSVDEPSLDEPEAVQEAEATPTPDNPSVIGLEKDFKELEPEFEFNFDPDSNMYVLSQNGQCIENFPNIGKARSSLNRLKAETNNNNDTAEDTGW